MTPAAHLSAAGALAALLAYTASAAEIPLSAAQRRQEFAALVSSRAAAIDHAFGETFAPVIMEARIRMVSAKEAAATGLHGAIYDAASRTLVFPHRSLSAPAPAPQWATQYWPYYEEPVRTRFAIVRQIDGVLWSAFLTEAARASGLSWPHAGCSSVDIAQRLPCEMLVYGVLAHITRPSAPLFNENRLDEIWPEDFEEFRARIWRRDEPAYFNAQRYGGFMLLRPLIREFGAPRALGYVARTPFRIEHNNLRLSAERYQQRAREALIW